MKCQGHFENIKLQLGDYHLKTYMFSIDMGGCVVVLGVEWLNTLGLVTMEVKYLYLIFIQHSHTQTLKAIQSSSHNNNFS